jgi:hypothetical protein
MGVPVVVAVDVTMTNLTRQAFYYVDVVTTRVVMTTRRVVTILNYLSHSANLSLESKIVD